MPLKFALAVVLSLGVGACQREATSPIAAPTQASKNWEYLDEGNPCDDVCELDGIMDMATQVDDPPPANAPLWSGQTTSISNAWVCPPFVGPVRFQARLQDGSYVTFNVSIMVPLIQIPKPASYFGTNINGVFCQWTVDRDYISEDGQHKITGGGKVILISQVAATISPKGKLTFEGPVYAVQYIGSVYGGGTGTPENLDFSDRGWAYADSTGFQNGTPGGWPAVIQAFVNGGSCVKGWEMWIDGLMVCDAYGNRTG